MTPFRREVPGATFPSLERIIQGFITRAIENNKKNKHCHLALLLNKGKVIYHGFNQMDRQYYRGKSTYSLHAEIDCLRKCRPIRDIIKRNYSLVVVKVSRSSVGKLYNSMPCKCCTDFIRALGFKKIYCSNDEGKIVKVILNNYIPFR